LIGGGRHPLPGEVSLAHHGVLFLDELPEFSRHVLEVLREPIESGSVNISRAAGRANYPASFQLIAAMNPCPCGYASDPVHACKCSSEQIQRYRNKISGPLLDRIDMHIEVPSLPIAHLSQYQPKPEESSAIVQQRVILARAIQEQRNQNINAKLTSKQIAQFCLLDECAQTLLITALEKWGISARAYHRILKVARTIADLDQSQDIASKHLTEAMQYRKLDRQY
jgi:magnesium chelatase family protein